MTIDVTVNNAPATRTEVQPLLKLIPLTTRETMYKEALLMIKCLIIDLTLISIL